MSTPAACDGHRITAYVDGVLRPRRGPTSSHTSPTAPTCRDQETFERGLRERMRGLSTPECRPGSKTACARRCATARLPPSCAGSPWPPGSCSPCCGAAAPRRSWPWRWRGTTPLLREGRSWRPRSGRRTRASWRVVSAARHRAAAGAFGGGRLELVGARFCPLWTARWPTSSMPAEKRHLSYMSSRARPLRVQLRHPAPGRERAPGPHGRGHAGHRGRGRGHGRGVPARAVE